MAFAPAFGPSEDRGRGLMSYEKDQGAEHPVADDEVKALADFLNDALAEDTLVADILPLDRRDATALISAFADGRLLTSLVNAIRPGIVATGAYANYEGAVPKHATSVYQCLNRALEGASRIPGVRLTNVGAVDFVNGKAGIILGTVRQLILARTLNLTSLRHHPETIRLLKDNESLDEFYRRPREEVLLRWFNFQLEAAKSSLRVANFSTDLKSCRAYEILLRQLDQDGKVGVASLLEDGVGGNGSGLVGPAAAVIAAAHAVGVGETLTLPRDIVKGSANPNLLLVAQLFHARPQIPELSPHEVKLLVTAAKTSGNADMIEDLRAYAMTRQDSVRRIFVSTADTSRHRTGGGGEGSRSASRSSGVGGGSMTDLDDCKEDPEMEMPASEQEEEEGLIYEVDDDEAIPRCIFCGMSWGSGGGGGGGDDVAVSGSKSSSEKDIAKGPEDSYHGSGVSVSSGGGNGAKEARHAPQEQAYRQGKRGDMDICVIS